MIKTESNTTYVVSNKSVYPMPTATDNRRIGGILILCSVQVVQYILYSYNVMVNFKQKTQCLKAREMFMLQCKSGY